MTRSDRLVKLAVELNRKKLEAVQQKFKTNTASKAANIALDLALTIDMTVLEAVDLDKQQCFNTSNLTKLMLERKSGYLCWQATVDALIDAYLTEV